MLDGLTNTIVGVMPQGFDYPHGSDIWRPMQMSEKTELPVDAQRAIHIVNLLARVRPGAAPQGLESEMNASQPSVPTSTLPGFGAMIFEAA